MLRYTNCETSLWQLPIVSSVLKVIAEFIKCKHKKKNCWGVYQENKIIMTATLEVSKFAVRNLFWVRVVLKINGGLNVSDWWHNLQQSHAYNVLPHYFPNWLYSGNCLTSGDCSSKLCLGPQIRFKWKTVFSDCLDSKKKKSIILSMLLVTNFILVVRHLKCIDGSSTSPSQNKIWWTSLGAIWNREIQQSRVHKGTLNCLMDTTLASVWRHANLLQKERVLPQQRAILYFDFK